MNIYFNRIALQKIFNLNFFQLSTVQSLSAPLAQRRCSHKLDVVCQKTIGHIRLLQFFHFSRRNNNCMHIAVIQYINQRLVIREYLYAHHHLINQFRLIRYETTQTIVITQVDAQRFRNVHSRFLSTIYKDIGTMTSIKIQKFIEHLHNYTWARHNGKANDIRHKQYTHRCQTNIQITCQKHTRNH